MSFLNKLFKKSTTNQTESISNADNTNILNLNKGDILNLTKTNPSLTKVKVSVGWKVNKSITKIFDYDLDLCAAACINDRLYKYISYSNKNEIGYYLDHDNMTGTDSGDAENIFVDLTKINPKINKIVFAVVIYKAAERDQIFNNVKNAYIKIIDDMTGKEICKYSLSNNGGKKTAAKIGCLIKDNQNNWSFEAMEEYSNDSIESLMSKI